MSGPVNSASPQCPTGFAWSQVGTGGFGCLPDSYSGTYVPNSSGNPAMVDFARFGCAAGYTSVEDVSTGSVTIDRCSRDCSGTPTPTPTPTPTASSFPASYDVVYIQSDQSFRVGQIWHPTGSAVCTGSIIGHGQLTDPMPLATRCVTNKNAQGYGVSSNTPAPPLDRSINITDPYDNTGNAATLVYYTGGASDSNGPFVIRTKLQERGNACRANVRLQLQGVDVGNTQYDFDPTKGVGSWSGYMKWLPASSLPGYVGQNEEEGVRASAYFAAHPEYDSNAAIADYTAGRCPPW